MKTPPGAPEERVYVPWKAPNLPSLYQLPQLGKNMVQIPAKRETTIC